MSESERLRREIAELEFECERRLSSGRFRLGALLLEAARDWRQLPRLPLRVWRLWRSVRRRRRPPGPGSGACECVRERLERLRCKDGEDSGERILFIFSGTGPIQGVRGNRPIRLALAARKRGIPVVFSYYRTRYDDPMPEIEDSGLIQVPLDSVLQLKEELVELAAGRAAQLFYYVSASWCRANNRSSAPSRLERHL